MKINTPTPGFSGSFGIPPQMRAAEEKFREDQAKSAEPAPSAEGADFHFSPQAQAATPAPEVAPETLDSVTPSQVLKKIGIELDEDDFQRLFFRGYIEKEVSIFPSQAGKKAFTVTMKTLTGQEYDEIDELLAEDIQDLKMTNDGYATRRNMWTLSFAVSQLAGKPLCKPVMKQVAGNEVVDLKETAKKRRDILSRLSGSVISKMMRSFGTLSVAINELVENPESELLKKS